MSDSDAKGKDSSTEKTSSNVSRRRFVQWAAGIAAAGVVGVGLGVGGDVIAKAGKTVTSTAVSTATTTKTISANKTLSASTTPSTTSVTTSSTAVSTQTIVDLAGRTVEIPSNVKRVVTLHPLATQAVWRLAPQKLMNIDRVFDSRLGTFLTDPTDLALLQSLPVTGVYFDPPNQEQIASLEPDLIVSLVGDTYVNTYQQIYGCPAILGQKTTLNDYATSFQVIGQAVGNPTTGAQLANYWNATLDQVTNYTAYTPESSKLKVYYGSHNAILTTPGTSTIMSSILSLAGTIGFASANPGASLAATNESGIVSVEQLVEWNPDVIVVTNGTLVPQVMTNPQFQNINAVINKQVYANPVEETFDGTNCLMGLVWISTLLNPNTVDINFLSQCQSYYSLFNNYNTITQAQTQLPGQGW